jgi:choline-phosphate cytidylyltransferase
MSPGKFIPTRRTPGISTSSILERIVKGYRNNDFDKKLEKMGCAELMAQGSRYDSNVERDAPGRKEQRSR